VIGKNLAEHITLNDLIAYTTKTHTADGVLTIKRLLVEQISVEP
jgi:hypothetical protein